jgi:hypothetical protein
MQSELDFSFNVCLLLQVLEIDCNGVGWESGDKGTTWSGVCELFYILIIVQMNG